jgi:archaellum biogenesis ATPase FlaH
MNSAQLAEVHSSSVVNIGTDDKLGNDFVDPLESNTMLTGDNLKVSSPIPNRILKNRSCEAALDGDCFTLKEILGIDFSEIPFVVTGLIPAGCLSIIVGESDIGKSTLHTQLAMSIVSGTPKFLGRDINVKHKRVLMVSTEEGISAIGNRIQKQMKKIPIDPDAADRLTILTTSDDIVRRIKENLRKAPSEIVIIDAFSDIFLSDMNISNKVRSFFNHYTDIIREFKCTIIFIHHIGKSREGLPLHKNQVLGSVGIVDKARQVLWLSRDKKSSSKRQLTIIKGNYVTDEEKNKSLILNFDGESRTFEFIEEKGIKNSNIAPSEVIEKDVAKEIHKLKAQGMSRKEIEEITGVERTTQWRYEKKYPQESNTDNDV